MRRIGLVALGAGAMAVAWAVFASAFSDDGFLGTMFGDSAVLLTPAVIIAAGVVAALVDGRVSGYAFVAAGAVGIVLAFAAFLRLTQGPDAEALELGAIGAGLGLVMLAIGFVPTALIRRLSARRR